MAELQDFKALTRPKGIDWGDYVYDPKRAAKENAVEKSPALLDIRGTAEQLNKITGTDTKDSKDKK